jgi:hypothetical protein
MIANVQNLIDRQFRLLKGPSLIVFLWLDYIVKNSNKKNNRYSGFIEESDSLLILIKKSSSIFQLEKRIIYDFARVPREFGSDTIIGASYKIIQLNDRWYFSTVGLD